jgi:ABC-type cobalamin/Fe3+-siderophores transport system ATPase subunit
MIALMGASGAGKTTLLNTLAQRQKMGVVMTPLSSLRVPLPYGTVYSTFCQVKQRSLEDRRLKEP